MLLLEHAKTLVRDLVLPPAGLLLLALLAALALRRWPRAARVLLWVSLLALWALSLPAVSFALARITQHYGALDLRHPTGAQAIVILGGGGQEADAPEYGGPAAGPYLLEKLAYGAWLARHTGLPILITGWHIETEAMRDSLQRNFGVRPRWIDAQAYDTFENARNAAHLLRAAGIHRIVLVTTTLHMWRATHEFLGTGLSVVPAPMGVIGPPAPANQMLALDYVPDAQALVRSSSAIYELLGERVRELLALTHLRRHQG